jgi:hypothetical protein
MDRPARYLPPDWEPPSADAPEDIDRSNKAAGIVVLCVIGAVLIIAGAALWRLLGSS